MTPEMEIATRHVLWHFGDRVNGWEPGSFTQALLEAISKADPQNRRNLALGFPREVTLMAQAMDVDGGMVYLKATVKR